MRKKLVFAVMAAMVAVACSPPQSADTPAEEASAAEVDVAQRAAELARDLIIVDTHIDVPYRLGDEMEDISQRTEKGDFDHPRAVAGGLNAPFMSIYVPSAMENNGAYEFAETLIDMVEGFAEQWPDKFAVATSPADVRSQFEQGVMSLPMGMENGAPIEDDLAIDFVAHVVEGNAVAQRWRLACVWEVRPGRGLVDQLEHPLGARYRRAD